MDVTKRVEEAIIMEESRRTDDTGFATLRAFYAEKLAEGVVLRQEYNCQ